MFVSPVILADVCRYESRKYQQLEQLPKNSTAMHAHCKMWCLRFLTLFISAWNQGNILTICFPYPYDCVRHVQRQEPGCLFAEQQAKNSRSSWEWQEWTTKITIFKSYLDWELIWQKISIYNLISKPDIKSSKFEEITDFLYTI